MNEVLYFDVGDIVEYRLFPGRDKRLFRVDRIDEKHVYATALNGYRGTQMKFDRIERPFSEVGVTQKVASWLQKIENSVKINNK